MTAQLVALAAAGSRDPVGLALVGVLVAAFLAYLAVEHYLDH